MSLPLQLLLAVNAVIFTAFAGLLVLDYRSSMRHQLEAKQLSLNDEASVLLAGLRHAQGLPAIQAVIDDACGAMRESSSPGHAIAVRVGNQRLWALNHPRGTAHDSSAVPAMGATQRLVGTSGSGNLRVEVSELNSDVRDAVRGQLLVRAAGVAAFGALTTLVLNAVLLRLVTRPVSTLVAMVKRVGERQPLADPPPFRTRELRMLARELVSMAASLANAEAEHRAQMLKARRIQQALLPSRERLSALGVAHTYLPAEEVGGDFFELKPLDDGTLWLCIGDVAGHGVPAAMGAAMLAALFSNLNLSNAAPGQILTQINRSFHALTLDGQFATMLLVEVDEAAGFLRYANAGHETAYVLPPTPHKAGIKQLTATGLVLGIDPDAVVDTAELAIAGDEILLMFSDGVPESISPQGRLLGRAAIVDLLSEAGRGSSAQAAVDQLVRRCAQHRAGHPEQDDLTVAAVAIGSAAGPRSRSISP